ncbi:MAG: hypothetical protein MJ149_00255 [Clostridia bacterium]|nr:hypothetical protein [Clostridia bacterium]
MGLFKISNSKVSAYATSEKVTISNSNFTSKSTKSAPTDFTFVNSTHASETYSAQTVETKVICLTDLEYHKYNLASRFSDTDDYVLMFKNTASATLDYGYRTSSTISLSADSYYMISADVYTDTADGIASMYLTGANKQEVYALRNKSSKNQWTTYMFFVKTTEAKSVYLELHINGKGVVLYDNLSASKLSADEYNLRKSSANNKTYIATEVAPITSFEFESGLLTEVEKQDATTTLLNLGSDTEVPDTFNNQSALKIDATSGKANYDVNSSNFTFLPNRIYKVSVIAKAKSVASNGKVTLTYSPTVKADVTTSTEKSLSITSSTSSSFTNNYKVYSFYVKSHPTETKTYKLNIGVEKAVAYFSQIQLSNVSYSTYNNVSTGSVAQTIDLAASYTSSSTQMLENGHFDDAQAKDAEKAYPADPASWTVTTGKQDHTQVYGVINTAELASLQTNYNLIYLIPYLTTPDRTLPSNNMLRLYNSADAEKDPLSYKSSTKTFAAKETHKIIVSVLPQNAPTDLSLVATVDEKEVTICSYSVQPTGSWQTVAFYVNGGERDLEVALKVSLTSQNYAYAFVDAAWFDYYAQPTSVDATKDTIRHTVYNQIVSADLTNLVVAETPEKNYATPLYFTGNGTATNAGIITNTTSHSALVNEAYKTSFETIGNSNSLAINMLEKGSYSFTSKLPYALNQDKHYAISLKVYTENLETDENGHGLTLKLSEFEEEFKNVSTEKDGANGWKTYTFYVNPNKTVNSYLTIALGSEELKASGKVFVADIAVDDSLENFNSVSKENALFLTKTIEAEEESEEETEPEETKENTGISTQTLIYMIPSIIFAVAIVITVAAVLMKKVNFKKPAKKTKNEYDRTKTVSKQFYMRKATMLREERLRELEKQAEELKAQREQFEQDYKHNLSRLRELKIKRGNPAEIKQLEKEMKHAQHTASGFGLTLSKIENDIAYTKTDAYINSTIRKLQSAPIKVEEKDTEKDAK